MTIPTGPSYIYRGTLHRVVDGDSYEIQCDLGFRTYSRVMMRLVGYSCPELREVGGPEAADAAERLLSGRALLLQSYKDRQSFARWLVELYVFTNQWESVGELLVAGGHAVKA